LDAYKIGGKEITFKININDTVIGSFPKQFSTKADKLIIPGPLPDFFQYYLQSNEIEQLNGANLLVNGSNIPPRQADDGLELFINLHGASLDTNDSLGYGSRIELMFEVAVSVPDAQDIFMQLILSEAETYRSWDDLSKDWV
jgi:hypothetical protein